MLSALVIVPAVAAVLVALVPARHAPLARWLGVAAATGVGVLSVGLLWPFEVGDPGFQLVVDRSWIAELGVSWHLGVDGISLFLVLLTGVLFPLVMAGVSPHAEAAHHDARAYTAWLLVLEAGCMGAFLALDLFVFFVMFEVVLVPMYFLIGGWGYGESSKAATKFFLFTMAGSAFLLVGVLAVAFLNQRATGTLTFDLVTLAEHQELATGTGRWLFLAFAAAFAVKTPIFPLHTWLPDAHTQAPTAGSVILAGVMLKLGTYGFLRFAIYLFPEAAAYFAPLLVTLGVIGIVYAAVVAAVQPDLKRLIAYSSVAHLGFIVLGLFAFTRQSLTGSVVQMVSHGVSTGALFLLVGMIYERRHTREVAKLGGLQKSAPVLAATFTIVMFSSIGLPGLNGFVGEFLILLGSFETRRWWVVVATTGVILAAVYLLWAYQRVFHGTPEGENARMPDLTLREGLVLVPLLAAIVFMGVYPRPVLDRVQPAVDRLVRHIDDRSSFDEPEPEPAPAASTEVER